MKTTKNSTELSLRDQYFEKIYGKWYNLVAAGVLFVSYAVFSLLYVFYLYKYIDIPYVLERYPGCILIIMGFFFGGNAIKLRVKDHKINNVLLARGIFDVLSGIFILILPEFGAMMTMLTMGVVLIHLGVKDLVDFKSTLWQLIRSVIFIPAGLSDVDVINYFLPYEFRILFFALFLGGLGVFLIWASKQYKEATANMSV